MKKVIVWVIIIIIICVIVGFIVNSSSSQNMSTGMTMPVASSTTSTTAPVSPVSTSSVSANTATVDVAISDYAFSPKTLTIAKGTTVVWTNKDAVAHTVTGDNGGPASGSIAQGATYSYTFNTAGTFAYHCAIHPMMTATVVVQ